MVQAAAENLMTHRPLNVVIVDEEMPYPANSGKRIRTLNLTLRLAQRHRITYICHRNTDIDEARQAEAFLRDHGIATTVVDRVVPPKQGLFFLGRLAANLLSPLPYSVESHTSAALLRAVQNHAAHHPVDLWQAEWTPYAETIRGMVSGKRLVVAHNVESLIWQRYTENESNPFRRWYIRQQWRKFETFESKTLTHVDHTVAVSAADARLFADRFGVKAISVVDNGVDTSFFTPGGVERDPARLLFLGSLDWRPNLDAVVQLLDHVFPSVRAQLPEARLWIVGRRPPPWLHRQVLETPGAELHADVADVRPFLARSAALVVPLRIGGGSRLKILEALSSGVPVVSTRVGAEGLHLTPGRHVTLAEDVQGMAEATLELLRDPESANLQASQGRREVLRLYDWDVLADRLDQVWQTCVNPISLDAREGSRAA